MHSTSKESWRPSSLAESIQPMDISSDFADPYSDLSLFLSQKVKEEVQEEGVVKKWSTLLQEKLIEKITPEFEKRFPNSRLGVHAVRKTFEKIAYYHQQMGQQKEALTRDGKLNLSYLIKENLRQYFQHKSPSSLHPYHFAHQLAMKLSDCMATMEGTRPMLDHLARTIWAVQRHMLPASSVESAKSPYDEFDKLDRLIVKTMLEISGKHPQIAQQELEERVKEAMQQLQELPSFTSFDRVTANTSCLLAEKLYPISNFHTLYFSEQKQAIFTFIRRHLKICKAVSPLPLRAEWVRRTAALYTLASSLPKDVVETESPPQPVKAFLAAEEQMSASPVGWAAYEEAKLLPPLSSEHLEMVIWKMMSEEDGFLQDLPYRVGLKLEEEISYVLIDHPHMHFTTVVDRVVQFFKRAKELMSSKKWPEIEKKISLWTMQGDLVCRWLKIDPENMLLKQVVELAKVKTVKTHAEFIAEATQLYLRSHPHLAPYTPHVMARISILYKYTWYALVARSDESSFDRFLAWHRFEFPDGKNLSLLEEICKKTLPLIPFDSSLLTEEEPQPENHQRHA
jgi:hypothetical protein